MNIFETGAPYYPISLKIKGRKCFVIGGGAVAFRKVNMLLEFGAVIKVISERFCPELVKLEEDGKVSLVSRRYSEGDLEGAVLAIAATDDNDINHRISTEARSKGILINVVDDPEKSDFIVPSYLRRGTITISVSTGGSSPALARNIRERLEKIFGDEYAEMAELISDVRAELKEKGIKIDGDTWQEALDPDWLVARIKKGRREEARTRLLDRLEKAEKGEL